MPNGNHYITHAFVKKTLELSDATFDWIREDLVSGLKSEGLHGGTIATAEARSRLDAVVHGVLVKHNIKPQDVPLSEQMKCLRELAHHLNVNARRRARKEAERQAERSRALSSRLTERPTSRSPEDLEHEKADSTSPRKPWSTPDRGSTADTTIEGLNSAASAQTEGQVAANNQSIKILTKQFPHLNRACSIAKVPSGQARNEPVPLHKIPLVIRHLEMFRFATMIRTGQDLIMQGMRLDDEDRKGKGSGDLCDAEDTYYDAPRLITLKHLIKKDLGIKLQKHRLWYLSGEDLLPIEISSEQSFQIAIKEMLEDRWLRLSFFLTRVAELEV
jgi:hypothetical protein